LVPSVTNPYAAHPEAHAAAELKQLTHVVDTDTKPDVKHVPGQAAIALTEQETHYPLVN